MFFEASAYFNTLTPVKESVQQLRNKRQETEMALATQEINVIKTHRHPSHRTGRE